MPKDNVYSSTKWETSHYGGYRGLIMDHPEVHVDWDVEYEIHKHKDLSFYSGSKLMDIFLLKVKQYNLVTTLVNNPDIIVKKSMFGFGNKKVGQINKDTQKIVLEAIIKAEREYRALFLHYVETILTADIQVKLPNEEENQEDGEDQDGDKKKEEKEEKKSSKGKGKGKSKEGSDQNKEEQEGSGGKSEEKEEQEDKKKSPRFAKGKPKPKPEDLTPEQRQAEKDKNQARLERALAKIFNDVRKRERIVPDNITGVLKKKTSWKYPAGSPNKKSFTSEQEKHAKSLVRLLDINFDPNVDKLNSLRNGKLDARKIGEVPSGNLNVYYKIEPNQTTKPFSVVLLVDESGSMDGSMECAVDCVKTLYLAFSEILPPSKLSVYGHSGRSSPEIYVYKDPYHDNFSSAIGTMVAKEQNYDGPIIESIYERVRSYTEDNIIFIVLSDGAPCGDKYGGSMDNLNLKRIVEKCRRDGFVTVGVGIFHDTSHLYDYNCIINDLGPDMVKKTSHIINSVVKKEFQ